MTACMIGLSSDEMEMQDLAEQEQAECQQRVAELLEQVINYPLKQTRSTHETGHGFLIEMTITILK